MNLNAGDRLLVVREVFDKQYILKPGTSLEVIWCKKKTMDHIRRCIDQNGRTRYVHIQDVDRLEKIYAAPETPTVNAFTDIRRPTESEAQLLKQIDELKNLQNILAEQRAREISTILESKGAIEAERDEALRKLADQQAPSPENDLIARLKANMRNWILAIQFSAPHAAMRKELQGFLKEL